MYEKRLFTDFVLSKRDDREVTTNSKNTDLEKTIFEKLSPYTYPKECRMNHTYWEMRVAATYTRNNLTAKR